MRVVHLVAGRCTVERVVYLVSVRRALEWVVFEVTGAGSDRVDGAW